MGNVYLNKQGLHVMEVEYGWGMDMEAIEFPPKLAEAGLSAGIEFLKRNPKAQRPGILFMMNYCSDVLDNIKKGERTFILDGFWQEQVEEIKNVIEEICQNQPIASVATVNKQNQ